MVPRVVSPVDEKLETAAKSPSSPSILKTATSANTIKRKSAEPSPILLKPSPLPVCTPSPSSRQRTIRFYNRVTVLLIPSRHLYPKKMRASIWASTQEIRVNARRNAFEYAAEGWNWRTAVEEEDMYLAANGEHIHPAHVVPQVSSHRRRHHHAKRRESYNHGQEAAMPAWES